MINIIIMHSITKLYNDTNILFIKYDSTQKQQQHQQYKKNIIKSKDEYEKKNRSSSSSILSIDLADLYFNVSSVETINYLIYYF